MKSGRSYHEVFNPPKKAMTDDVSCAKIINLLINGGVMKLGSSEAMG